MADATTPTTDAPDAVTVPETTVTITPPEPKGDDEAEKWKKLSRKNEAELRKAQAELERVQQSSMTEQEKAVAQARAEGRADALKTATERLLRAEVRVQAADLLADPGDAVHLLDLSSFVPDADGNYDTKAIRAELLTLVKAKPYLGAQPGTGAGEGGPRGRGGNDQALNGDPLERALKDKLGIT